MVQIIVVNGQRLYFLNGVQLTLSELKDLGIHR